MALGTQHTAEETFWYLVADDARVAIRIHSGLCIGEDAAGDLNFKSAGAQISFELVGDEVVIRTTSDADELLVASIGRTRSVTVGVNDAAQIELGHNLLEILLGFDHADFSSDKNYGSTEARHQAIKIQVVAAASNTALNEVVGEGMSIASLLRPRRTRRESAADSVTGTSLPTTPRRDPEPLPSIDLSVVRVGETAAHRGRRLKQAIPYVILALLIAISLTMVLIAPDQDAVEKDAPPSSETRVTNLAAPFQGETLPPLDVMGLAVHSLVAIHTAEPGNERVHKELVFITERIAAAALQHFNLGDAFTAGRLIELASASGVAQTTVAEAIATLSQPPRSAATLPQEALLQESEGDAPGAGTEGTSTAPTSTNVAQLLAPSNGRVAAMTPSEQNPTIDELLASAAPPDKAPEQDKIDLQTSTPRGPSSNRAPVVKTSRAPASVDLEPPNTPALPASEITEKKTFESEPAVNQDVIEETATADYIADTADTTGIDEQPIASASNTTIATDATIIDEQPIPNAWNTSIVTDTAIDTSLQTPIEEEFETGLLPPTDLPLANSAPLLDQRPEFYPLSTLTVVERPAPVYPRSAPDGARATMMVEITVTESGAVGEINIASMEGRGNYFRKAATKAIRDWKFEPVIENNQPISVRTAIRLTFEG